MNHVLFETKRSETQEWETTNPRVISHIKNHLKKSIGDSLKGALLEGPRAVCEISSLTDKYLSVRPGKLVPPERQRAHLLIALSRPPTWKKVFEHATTMGAASISLFIGQLSDKSYLNSPVFKKDSIDKLLRLGVEQSGAFTKLPKVNIYRRSLFDLEEIFQEKMPNITFSPEISSKKSSTYPSSDFRAIIGPERGLSAKELAYLKDLETLEMSLGPSILRVEHAVYSVLAKSTL